MEEVGDEFRFAVLFALDGAFFGYDGAVVVGGVAARVAEVACSAVSMLS